MMLKSLQKLYFMLLAVFLLATATASKAEESLLDGVRVFDCEDDPIVLIQDGEDWAFGKAPEAKIKAIRNGWQFGDQGLGFIAYLRTQDSSSWTLEGLSEYEYEKVDCTDLTDTISDVITFIKPRLNDAIAETQKQLSDTLKRTALLEVLQEEQEAKLEKLADNEAMVRLLELEVARLAKIEAKWNLTKGDLIDGSYMEEFFREQNRAVALEVENETLRAEILRLKMKNEK